MKLRGRKSSANDMTVYNLYVAKGMAKYGKDGWMTSKIVRKVKTKHPDEVISVTIIPSML